MIRLLNEAEEVHAPQNMLCGKDACCLQQYGVPEHPPDPSQRLLSRSSTQTRRVKKVYAISTHATAQTQQTKGGFGRRLIPKKGKTPGNGFAEHTKPIEPESSSDKKTPPCDRSNCGPQQTSRIPVNKPCSQGNITYFRPQGNIRAYFRGNRTSLRAT